MRLSSRAPTHRGLFGITALHSPRQYLSLASEVQVRLSRVDMLTMEYE